MQCPFETSKGQLQGQRGGFDGLRRLRLLHHAVPLRNIEGATARPTRGQEQDFTRLVDAFKAEQMPQRPFWGPLAPIADGGVLPLGMCEPIL